MSDGHDLPGLIDELVPGVAAVGDDILVGREDAVGQPVVAQELPDVFDRVELRRPRGQVQERDVGGDRQVTREMPAGLIQEDDRMGAGRHLGCDLVQMPLHCPGVAAGQDEANASSRRVWLASLDAFASWRSVGPS